MDQCCVVINDQIFWYTSKTVPVVVGGLLVIVLTIGYKVPGFRPRTMDF
jgi:hypothetical protein